MKKNLEEILITGILQKHSIFYSYFQALLTCLSKHAGQTQLNKNAVPYQGLLVLNHKDVFTIGDRSFRWEYPDDSPHLVVSTPKKASSKKASSSVKVNVNGNGHGHALSGKGGDNYPAMTPKALAKASAEAKADTPHTSHSKRVSFGPYVSPEYIGKFLLEITYISWSKIGCI